MAEGMLNVEFWVVGPDGTYGYQCWKGLAKVRVSRDVGAEDGYPETLETFSALGEDGKL